MTTATFALVIVAALSLAARYGWLRLRERRNTRHHTTRRAIRWEQE